MRREILVLGFLALLFAENPAHAGPIFITRGLLIHPIYTPSVADTGGFLTRTSMWGGVQRGLGSKEDRFGWLLDVGAAVELYQWQTSSLLAVSGMQLNADTHNDIAFNPSGVTWEEHLMYATRGEGLNWQLGFAQRCRHDVDNLDIKKVSGEAQQRTLIYSSISGKLIPTELDVWGLGLSTWLNGDLYLISQDYRIPKITSDRTPNIERLAASTGLTFELSPKDRSTSGFYFILASTFSFYGSEAGLYRKVASIDDLLLEHRGELGYRIPGRGGNLRIFVGSESFGDDGTMPIPEANNYFFIGFRITGRDLFN